MINKNTVFLGALWIMCATCLSTVFGFERSDEQEAKFNQLTMDVETPHTKWAKPWIKGSIRALIIAPRYAQRDTVELAQRMDLDFENNEPEKFNQIAANLARQFGRLKDGELFRYAADRGNGKNREILNFAKPGR